METNRWKYFKELQYARRAKSPYFNLPQWLCCVLWNVWPLTQSITEPERKKLSTPHFLIDFMWGQPGDYIRVRCRGRRAEMNVVVQLVLINRIVFDILQRCVRTSSLCTKMMMMKMIQGNNSARLALRDTASSFHPLVSSERLISWKAMHGESRSSIDTKLKNALYIFQKLVFSYLHIPLKENMISNLTFCSYVSTII